MSNLKIFSGRESQALANKIVVELSKKKGFKQIKLGKMEYKNFSDKEIWLRYGENIRGCDLFLIQSTPPPSDNLMELLIMIDGAKRASAKTITAVIPYFGYARQDRKDQPRVPITAKLVADMLQTAGVNRVITMDLHASQIQGFFNIPVDHLYASAIFISFLKKKKIKDLAIVSPDAGGMKLARAYSKLLKADLIMIDKQRDPKKTNVCEVMNIIGDPKNKNLIVIDDLIDTGGTILNAVVALKKKGAKDIYVFATHPVLSQGIHKFEDSESIKALYLTDTLKIKEENDLPFNYTISNPNSKIKQLTTTKLFAEAIARTYNNESISSLFEIK